MNGEGCTMYFNMICEEICVTGGKVIHIDKNLGEEEIHKTFWDNVRKYPKAKWEIYPMYINE
jgi:hypothetical protein